MQEPPECRTSQVDRDGLFGVREESKLKIGDLTLDFPVVLAALAGYSDLPYRTICRSLGAPFATTEVMLDRFLLHESKLRRFILKSDADDHPVGGQFMGSDPDLMAQAARVLRELGFDVIDLNFACPVKKVVSRKRGGYLMSKPAEVLEIVRRVRDAVPDRPLMLKLRKSFGLNDAETEAFWTIAHGAFAVGADALCVHARAVEQQYAGKADWAFLTDVKQAFPDRTIIGSGDVSSAAEALRMIDETGVDGAAAARGAIGNPWIFRQARELAAGRPVLLPTLEEQRELLLHHGRLCLRFYGDRKGVMTMRHLGIGYARVHPHPKRVRMAFVAVKTMEDWLHVLDIHYRDDGDAETK
jgi:nifR3 family TIM-barrel protein